MSKVDQLLAKAMSTSSEDEAIACLKMARKQGNTVEIKTVKPQKEQTPSVSEQKLKADLMKAVNAAQTWCNMYANEVTAKQKYQAECTRLKRVIQDKKEEKGKIAFAFIVFIVVSFALGGIIL